MSDKTHEVTINERFCKGCRLCIDVCPQGKLAMNAEPDMRGVQTAYVVGRAVCTGCRRCVTVCPDAAIQLYCIESAAEETE
jgi:2-oxoglutarate ferredoxin oxidoreductase subunit delta